MYTLVLIVFFIVLVGVSVQGNILQSKLGEKNADERRKIQDEIVRTNDALVRSNDYLSAKEDEMMKRNLETRRKLKRARDLLDTKISVLKKEREDFAREYQKERDKLQRKLANYHRASMERIDAHATNARESINGRFANYQTTREMIGSMGYDSSRNVYVGRDFVSKAQEPSDGNPGLPEVSLRTLYTELLLVEDLLEDSSRNIQHNQGILDNLDTKFKHLNNSYDTTFMDLSRNYVENTQRLKGEFVSVKPLMESHLSLQAAIHVENLSQANTAIVSEISTSLEAAYNELENYELQLSSKYDVSSLAVANSLHGNLESSIRTLDSSVDSFDNAFRANIGQMVDGVNSQLGPIQSEMINYSYEIDEAEANKTEVDESLKSYVKITDLNSLVTADIGNYRQQITNTLDNFTLTGKDFVVPSSENALSLKTMYDRIGKINLSNNDVMNMKENLKETEFVLDKGKVIDFSDTHQIYASDDNTLHFDGNKFKFGDLYINGELFNAATIASQVSTAVNFNNLETRTSLGTKVSNLAPAVHSHDYVLKDDPTYVSINNNKSLNTANGDHVRVNSGNIDNGAIPARMINWFNVSSLPDPNLYQTTLGGDLTLDANHCTNLDSGTFGKSAFDSHYTNQSLDDKLRTAMSTVTGVQFSKVSESNVQSVPLSRIERTANDMEARSIPVKLIVDSETSTEITEYDALSMFSTRFTTGTDTLTIPSGHSNVTYDGKPLLILNSIPNGLSTNSNIVCDTTPLQADSTLTSLNCREVRSFIPAGTTPCSGFDEAVEVCVIDDAGVKSGCETACFKYSDVDEYDEDNNCRITVSRYNNGVFDGSYTAFYETDTQVEFYAKFNCSNLFADDLSCGSNISYEITYSSACPTDLTWFNSSNIQAKMEECAPTGP